MELKKVLFCSQIFGHAIGLICSIGIIVPISMHQEDFHGRCLLFSTGKWSSTLALVLVEWASRFYCIYTINVGALLLIVFIVQIYRLTMSYWRGVDSSFLTAFLETVGYYILCGLTVSSAVIITLGFMAWCDTMLEIYPSCAMAAGQPINQKNISTKWFYKQMETAQFCVWAAFTTCVGLAVCSTLKVCIYHYDANINAERRSLLNGARSPPVQESQPTPS